jgi:hypothetical protein
LRGQRQVAGAVVIGAADIAGMGQRRGETNTRAIAITMMRIGALMKRKLCLFVRREGRFVDRWKAVRCAVRNMDMDVDDSMCRFVGDVLWSGGV